MIKAEDVIQSYQTVLNLYAVTRAHGVLIPVRTGSEVNLFHTKGRPAAPPPPPLYVRNPNPQRF